MAPSASDQTKSSVENFNGNGNGPSNTDDNSHPASASTIAPFPNTNQALPTLSTLASVASTSSPHLRYEIIHGFATAAPNMFGFYGSIVFFCLVDCESC